MPGAGVAGSKTVVEPPHPRVFRPAFLNHPQIQPVFDPLPPPPSQRADPSQILLEEESRLLLEARRLSKPYSEIAKMLPHHNVTSMKRHVAALLRKKVTAL